MDKKTITKAYWKLVWSEVKDSAWKEADMRGNVVSIAVTFVLGLVVTALYLTGVISVGVFDSVIGNVAFELAIFFLVLLYFAARIIILLSQVPARLYEQIGGLGEDPFELSARAPLPKSSSDFRSASITVKNVSTFRIEDCFITIDAIRDEKGESRLFSRQRRLLWSSGESTVRNGQRVAKELHIVRDEPRVCDIASTEPENKYIVLTTWVGSQSFGEGRYEVTITAHGQWRGLTKQKTSDFIMEYKGGNDLFVREK